MSKLRLLTFTGADDSVDPIDIIKLSKEFPLIEWGILRSIKREGQSRYPSQKWRTELKKTIESDSVDVKLSAHLCGRLARDFIDGNLDSLENDPNTQLSYRRVQVNGFSNYDLHDLHLGGLPEEFNKLEVILQCSNPAAIQRAIGLAANYANMVPFYDPSGGTGIRFHEYPEALKTGRKAGFAGAIGPDNIVEIIDMIKQHSNLDEFWIDGESKYRTDDKFDLNKIKKSIELTLPFVSTTQ